MKEPAKADVIAGYLKALQAKLSALRPVTLQLSKALMLFRFVSARHIRGDLDPRTDAIVSASARDTIMNPSKISSDSSDDS
jgi:hypothetical protein